MPEQTLNRPHYRRTLAITALALAVLLILGIRFGSTRLDLALIAHGISGTLTPEEAPHWYAFHQMRLPRALATALVGGNLALCGAVMQGLFRNPLVDPGIIGVMSGAAFSVTLYIVIGAEAFPALLHWLGDYALPVAAFAGSWLMTLTLYRFAKRGGQINIAAMLLIGIALSGFTGAITGLLTYIADDNQLRSLTFWGMGTLSKMDWQKLAILAAISAISLPWIHQDARVLNALMLGESAAWHLGFNIERAKKRQILLVALLVGSCVAFTGGIAFVGLIVPHIVRGLTGANNRHVLPVSFLLGAALLSLADLIARLIMAPAELPIGILTAAIGAPFLATLVWQRLGKTE